MSALSKEPAFTRLRDFGAFQPDISGLPTRKIGAVQPEPAIAVSEAAITGITPIIAETGRLDALHHGTDRAAVVTRLKASLFDRAALHKSLIVGIRVSITILLFAWLIRSLSWSTLIATLGRVQVEGVLVALVIGAGGIVVSAYQWYSLLRIESICYDLAELVKLYLVGISFSHFLPTGMGGDAIKALYVGRASGNKIGSACAVIMCRFTGFLGMLLIMFPVQVIWHMFLARELILFSVLLSLLMGLLICLTLLIIALLPEIVRSKDESQWTRARWLVPLIGLGDALGARVGRPFSFARAVLCGALFGGLAILNCYSYAHALGIVVPLYFYCVAVPVIALISFLPISINGFGVRESAFVYIFSTLHIAPATSLLLAFLLDAQAICFALIGGFLYLLVLRQRFKSLFS